jgi:hypothetical protein
MNLDGKTHYQQQLAKKGETTSTVLNPYDPTTSQAY